uniref:LIM zinc-binding domain-containing protein n=1 Tax=Labrus bergylta TaxID=56723 RepID=A0A3Q3GZX0_9LABR
VSLQPGGGLELIICCFHARFTALISTERLKCHLASESKTTALGCEIKKVKYAFTLISYSCWHLGCFKCKASHSYHNDHNMMLHCESSALFCAPCVFQAGDKHYHPSCARCRCNQMFTEERRCICKVSQHTWVFFLTVMKIYCFFKG